MPECLDGWEEVAVGGRTIVTLQYFCNAAVSCTWYFIPVGTVQGPVCVAGWLGVGVVGRIIMLRSGPDWVAECLGGRVGGSGTGWRYYYYVTLRCLCVCT